ncbi:phenylalanine N-monooxygenase [Ranunculus cassubicifolius]
MKTEIACIRLGKVHVIVVTCPEIGQEILRRQDAVFSSRPVQMCTEIATSGYLTVALTPNGDQWRKIRRVLVSEVFSVERHHWLHEKRIEVVDHITGFMYNLCSIGEQGGIVNVRNVAQHYCANLLRKLIFDKIFFGKGTIDGGPGMEEIEYVDSLFKILGHINAFSISNYLPWLRPFDLDDHEKILRNAMKILTKYNDVVIDERIHDSITEKKEEARDILDILIQLADPSNDDAPLLTPTEIKAQIHEMMFAAVDNPSHAVEWALAEMINQPMILNSAVEELDNVVGRNRLVQESNIPKLNYVNACAKEAFRLHPVAAFNLPHVSTADTNVAGYFIPKGSHVLVSRRGLGRNPKIWKDPLQYKPERHLKLDATQVVLDDRTLRVFSFGIGRRGCPAFLLGSTMTTMLLARLLHGFTWAPPPGISSINLAESKYDSLLSEPLLGLAKPRFPKHMYPTV